MNISNREDIIEQLTEMLMQFDKDRNGYQTDVYLYYDKETETAELDTFVNVGGNSWRNDDGFVLCRDKEHYDTVWDWFNSSTEIADVLEYSTYTEFEYDVRQCLEIEEDERIDFDDCVSFVEGNDLFMEKITAAYNEYIDEMRPDYRIQAEEILERFERERAMVENYF